MSPKPFSQSSPRWHACLVPAPGGPVWTQERVKDIALPWSVALSPSRSQIHQLLLPPSSPLQHPPPYNQASSLQSPKEYLFSSYEEHLQWSGDILLKRIIRALSFPFNTHQVSSALPPNAGSFLAAWDPGNIDQLQILGHLHLLDLLTAAFLPGPSGELQRFCYHDKLSYSVGHSFLPKVTICSLL